MKLKNYLPEKTYLVIPDCHQNIDWVESIIEKEKGNFDAIISLGDWYDSFFIPPKVYTVEQTTDYILYLKNNYEIYFVMGNHDLAYYCAMQFNYATSRTSSFSFNRLMHYPCSGFTKTKANSIYKTLVKNKIKWKQFFSDWLISYMANGWLISHAGVMPNYIPYNEKLEYNIDAFFNNCNDAIGNALILNNINLFSAGQGRGGQSRVGGPLWCDFHSEFDNFLKYPQLFGHTYCHIPTHKNNGYCIDGNQSFYSILDKSGDLFIKHSQTEKYDMIIKNK